MEALTFDPRQEFSEVILVGLGGTGSQIARTLCRIVFDLRTRQRHMPRLTFIDPDRVEQSNIGRQMFSNGDIGKYKAECLARRFSLAMGLSIAYHNEAFDAEIHAPGRNLLIVGAVDSHVGRAEMARVQGTVLDAGNATYSGQVCIGDSYDRTEILRGIDQGKCTHLPAPGLLFPALLKPEVIEAQPESDPQLSCSDLIVRGSQSLLINDAIGNIAGEYLYKLLNHVPVKTFCTFYASEDILSLRSLKICKEELLAYL